MSVSNRTIENVLKYIQRNTVDGTMTKALAEIADQIGYSNATIHRAFKQLQDENLIQVIPSEKPNVPFQVQIQGNFVEIKLPEIYYGDVRKAHSFRCGMDSTLMCIK